MIDFTEADWFCVGMENCKIINQTYVIPFVYFPNVSWRCNRYNHTSMQKLNYTRCQIVPIFKFTNRTIRSADISHWTKPTIMLSLQQCKARDISCNLSWFVSALVYIIWPRWSSPQWRPGPRLNIKTVLSTYGDFHVKDKTAVRTSYL